MPPMKSRGAVMIWAGRGLLAAGTLAVAAGFVLLFFGPYREGDYVVATQIATASNAMVVGGFGFIFSGMPFAVGGYIIRAIAEAAERISPPTAALPDLAK